MTAPMAPRPDYQYRGAKSCKGCGATIHWWETPAGRWSPHDQDGTSHFATCPKQAEFRRKGDRA